MANDILMWIYFSFDVYNRQDATKASKTVRKNLKTFENR